MVDSRADTFIKYTIKYSAKRHYIGDLSGNDINAMWNRFMETEYSGYGQLLHTGFINNDILEEAFACQMRYNPLRYNRLSCSENAPEKKIFKMVSDIKIRFAALWPNGIREAVLLTDIIDPQYLFLRDLRNTFRAIANLNMRDYKKSVYRDEIVAFFASSNINMAPDIRGEIIMRANASAENRQKNRNILKLQHRIQSLETNIMLNKSYDREYVLEMEQELDAAKKSLALLTQSIKKKKKNKNNNPAEQVNFDEDFCHDAYEREEDLLNTLTPEHNMGKTPDIFKEYLSRYIQNDR